MLPAWPLSHQRPQTLQGFKTFICLLCGGLQALLYAIKASNGCVACCDIDSSMTCVCNFAFCDKSLTKINYACMDSGLVALLVPMVFVMSLHAATRAAKAAPRFCKQDGAALYYCIAAVLKSCLDSVQLFICIAKIVNALRTWLCRASRRLHRGKHTPKAFASLLTSPALALPQWTAVISLLMLLKLQQVYQHHQDSQVQALP